MFSSKFGALAEKIALDQGISYSMIESMKSSG